MKKMLISGGAGFIGSEFVRQAILEDFEIAVVDSLTYAGDLKRIESVKNNLKFFNCDTSDLESLQEVFKQFRPQIVVHFAAETHVDRSILNPHIFIKTNIIGTQNMLELSKDALFINISTDEVYGDLSENDASFKEDSCLNPSSPYSASKAAQDMLARAYARTYNTNVITIRPSNNYGPWQYPEKLIAVVIYKALQDEPIPIYAKGENIREWTFVEDCAKAILGIIRQKNANEVYNLGSSIEKPNIEVVKSILALLNKPESLITYVKDRPGHDFRYSLDSSKIKKTINLAFTNFEEGIEKTVKWYIDNRDWLFKKTKELKDYWQKVYQDKS
ncbi:dTDP-glucose 4,6-dehydratase [Desulfurella amilsii]|uniref:dTDP-glucose 4,6-dehydratase n=1 Tax=Desulfurella amilsii TaxID=1562698 RepID=A0A1X4XWX7_9BACT|nr:dTDP-glucose 4,6-dehydratase [Desulfurella amilsii]OSS42039.1 dTDP-glucose 4,6-dehydratase [Desulfurella amilsii]